MIRTGCQGWNYTDWVTPSGAKHLFYPFGARQGDMLGLYSKVFDTVEVDSTFYAPPSADTFLNWYARSSEGFLFALKMPREITHEQRLGKAAFPAADEFFSRASLLKEKLGPILIQLPPSFRANRRNASRLREFLSFLPTKISFAVEFRDPAWLVEWTFRELEERGVWLCTVEGEWVPRSLWFSALERESRLPVYVRFMGARDLERFDRVVRPEDRLIGEWYDRLSALRERDAYVYFSNLTEGFAPASVNKLRELSGKDIADPRELEIQNRLFS
ncbi:MAG: DUF72 domain-containing protein [Aridibacter famidurans]|nr:DUF72 domain-containing protein [Aridibacter famidurans]